MTAQEHVVSLFWDILYVCTTGYKQYIHL